MNEKLISCCCCSFFLNKLARRKRNNGIIDHVVEVMVELGFRERGSNQWLIAHQIMNSA